MIAVHMRLSHATREYLTKNRHLKSKKTLDNYVVVLRLLSYQFNGDDPLLEDINTGHVFGLLERYDNPSTFNVHLSMVNTFFKWCVKNGHLRRNPCDPIERRKVQRRGAQVKHRIPVDQWDRLLDIADAYHPLDRAIIAVGLYLGSRSSEIRNIKLCDLEMHNNTVVKIKVFRSKQYWTAWVPVAGELAQELNRWLEWYVSKHGVNGELPANAYLLPARAHGGETRRPDGLFDHGGRDRELDMFTPLSRSSHHHVVQRVLKDAGFYKRGEGSHTLRRSVAAALYEEDIERGYSEALDTVKTFLGHASSITTESYIGTTFSERKLEERLVGQHMFRHNAAKDADNVVPLRAEGGIVS